MKGIATDTMIYSTRTYHMTAAADCNTLYGKATAWWCGRHREAEGKGLAGRGMGYRQNKRSAPGEPQQRNVSMVEAMGGQEIKAENSNPARRGFPMSDCPYLGTDTLSTRRR